MIYDAFTSDLHFSHKGIIRFCDRPYSSVEEMNEDMIKKFNDKVSHKDKVLFVGDIFFCKKKEAREILSQMNGVKHLVIGNHDFGAYDMLGCGFDMVAEKLFFKYEGKKVAVCHYDNWNTRSPYDDKYADKRHPLNLNEMEVLIHGHTHQKSKRLLHQVHVGVDAWEMGPARYEELAPIIKSIPDDWNAQMRKELENLTRYRELIYLINQLNSVSSQDPGPIQDELRSKKFDRFRILGWEKKTEKKDG